MPRTCSGNPIENPCGYLGNAMAILLKNPRGYLDIQENLIENLFGFLGFPMKILLKTLVNT